MAPSPSKGFGISISTPLARIRDDIQTPATWAQGTPLTKVTGPKGTNMASADSELQGLQKAEREACNRLARLLHRVTDPAAIEAAKSICAEATAAVRAYLAKSKR